MHEDAETEARVAEAVHREAAQWLRDVDVQAYQAWVRALADRVSIEVARRQADDMPSQSRLLFRSAVRERARTSALEALGWLATVVERLPSTSPHYRSAWDTTEACERLVDEIERMTSQPQVEEQGNSGT